MTPASHLFRWRRVLTVCAASAALHYAAIGWSTAPPVVRHAAPDAQPATVVVELRSAPAPLPQARPPLPAAEAGAALPLPQVQLSSSSTVAQSDAPVLPRYQARLPPPAQLVFDALRLDASGAASTGTAVMTWQWEGGQYRMAASMEVAGSTLVELASEGATGPGGIAPRKMSVQRRGKAATATHLDARQGRITFSASEDSAIMAPGTQDRATLPMQLSGIARAAGRLGADVTLMVAEEKGVSVMRFAVMGREEIDTGMGRLATWRLAYTPPAGTYRPRLEVWLAPGREWYPVQVRSLEASGAVTTQTISRIVANDVGI